MAIIVRKGYNYSEAWSRFQRNLFAPVARLSALAVECGNQVDVQTAYLNGELKEEVFMEVLKFVEELNNCVIVFESTFVFFELILCNNFMVIT